jgi:hypothetical protein
MVEHFPSKSEALSSNPSTTKNKNKVSKDKNVTSGGAVWSWKDQDK